MSRNIDYVIVPYDGSQSRRDLLRAGAVAFGIDEEELIDRGALVVRFSHTAHITLKGYGHLLHKPHKKEGQK